jgi:deoxyhypusine synthase
VIVTPKVMDTKLELKRFDLNRVGPVLLGTEEAREMGEELRGFLQDLMKRHETQVTEKLNEAIAKAVKEGKTKLSATTLLKLNLPKE